MWRSRAGSVGALVGTVLVLLVGCAPKRIENLKTFSYAGGQQQEGKIAYAETPPLGGAYSPLWQKCGVYTAPLYDEYAVHSLERGAVWMVYRPGLPAAELTRLKSLLAGHASWLLSPRAGLQVPVVLSAWNAQVQASGADDARLAEFLNRYAQPLAAQPNSTQASSGTANTAPEREKGCASGSTQTQ